MKNTKLPEMSKKKRFIVIEMMIAFFVLFSIIVYWLPVEKATPPYFLQKENERPLVIAHQGGKHLAPGNTIEAFQNAVDLGADVIETDIHITEDGHLVTIHDPTVDATTDGSGYVKDYTLKELQRLDAAYYFQDLKGQYSFRGKHIYVPTLEEVFQRFPDMRINIEVKDDNPEERIEEIVQKLMKLIEEYDMEDKILIASFDQNIINLVEASSKGRVATQGGKQEAKKFVILHKLFMRNLYKSDVDAFQLPLQEGKLDLTQPILISGAHRIGLQVHYWTVNDRETMERLIKLGADGIITDRPDLLLNILGRK
ncbi:glycerophosphodiester phosphodiesterase [Rossellomorea sp. SC111]|uniref:glycerophosphodiester phosphodiesterase n=1 Tax=Rossellomorea sp. SC111 TaxID=2968985 RepID=UPI00215B3E17|nr:glycerophosphodiester phosphodiesterase [Rossellomorea sp. SC111]MCR8848871.1 glycerophosphodiester phosphodiesterase [Rossellomorea sp. SC111]